MKKIVVLNGIHTSGKSTVGRYLNTQGVVYLTEIAMELHKEGIKIGVDGSEEVQIEMMNREDTRDNYVIETNADFAIESWYTAGLAHTRESGNSVYELLEDTLNRKMEEFDPIFVYFDFAPELIPQRGSKLFDPVDIKVIDFYKRLDQHYKEIYDKYNLNRTFVNADQPLERVCEEVKEVALEHFGGA